MSQGAHLLKNLNKAIAELIEYRIDRALKKRELEPETTTTKAKKTKTKKIKVNNKKCHGRVVDGVAVSSCQGGKNAHIFVKSRLDGNTYCKTCHGANAKKRVKK